MASTSYARLLVNVIILLLAVQYSTADVHEGNGSVLKWIRGVRSLTRNYVLFHNDNCLNANARKIDIGGRKMLLGLDENTQNVSGNDEPAAEVHGHDHSDDHSAKWLEAADEVANLMRKDYSPGKPQARRRSPIHNGEPRKH